MKIRTLSAWMLASTMIFGMFSSTVSFAKEAEVVPGQYLVQLKSQIQIQNYKNLSQTLGAQVLRKIPNTNILVVQKGSVELTTTAISQLSENPMVELVEPNYIYRVEMSPNDPFFGKLWGMQNTGQSDGKTNGTAGIDIDAVRAWDITQGSSEVVVAVIDTGIDYTHPDIKENMWVNQAEANGQAGVDDDNNGYVDDVYGFNFVDANKPTANPMDDHGHGTHCAGTIGGRGNDGTGVVGVNWNVKLMAIKFLGGDGGGTLEGAIKGIDYATKMGAKIMSNSWGGGGQSELLKQAIERANAAGVLFVAAAGNDSANNDSSPHYPSNYEVPNVLSVAAIDNNGKLASFSNYGKKTVHVAAPGVNIYSSVAGGKYVYMSGTSMATPHVSGVAALLLASDLTLTNDQLKQRLISSVRKLSSIKSRVSSGGLVNSYFAITNQTSPIDMNDPDQWAAIDTPISSEHPYKSNTNVVYEVRAPGAKEMAIYFSRFEMEKGYDKLTFFDVNGNKLGEMTGAQDQTYSPVFSVDYVKMVLTSDSSVNKYGFDIGKVSYR